MKIKRFFLGLCALAFLTSVQAQNVTKPVLTVEDFTGTVPQNALELLRNRVIAGIQKSGRVEVIDVHNEAALKAEQQRRESEAAMADAGRVDEMGSLMSNAILKGSIDNLTITRGETTDLKGNKKTVYRAVISYTLSIINAANGTLAKSENFENSATADTEGAAAAAALEIPQKPLERFINNVYKVEGKIEDIDEKDAKKAKTVYVSLGSNDGVAKGKKLEVFKEVTIAGKKSNKLIGEVTINEVMGESISLCKVNKGGEDILNEFNNGTKLPVRTKEEKAGFFSF